jgi:hypothetical protein
MQYKTINTAITAFKRKNKDPDYNDWFTFFQKLPANMVSDNQDDLKTKIPSDGYAALCRWIDIFENPSKMEKISKAKMDEDNESNIIELATGEDDEKFYVGMILEAAKQLNNSGTSPQEVARLSANINIFRKELREIRSRKPKAGSVLDKVLTAANSPPKKVVKTIKKVKSTPVKVVKKKAAAPKAIGTTKKKKTGKVPSKAKK